MRDTHNARRQSRVAIVAALGMLVGLLSLVSTTVAPLPAAAMGCAPGTDPVTITWGAGGLVQWPNDVAHSTDGHADTYTDIGGSTLDMTLSIDDPHARNEDLSNDLISRGLSPLSVFGWDDPFFTQTDGVYGLGYLTFVVNSEFDDEVVTFAFDFSTPVLVPDFAVGDVDAVGLGFAPLEEPHDSFQDEIELSASRGGVPVGFDIMTGTPTSPVITGPNSVAGLYQVNVSNNLAPADPAGTVTLSTTEPVTSFTFGYSNGPGETAVEPSVTYPPHPLLNPAGNAISNNHAVRIADFTVCIGALSIGETVYADVDGDGTEDPGEPGVPGVTVTLSDENGATIATTVTDGSGLYSFDELVPHDNWIVTITPPTGYTNTGDRDATPDGTTVVDNTAGANATDADFGLLPPPGTIDGTVFADRDNDGVLEGGDGDTGLGGVTVALDGADLAGNPISTSTTTGPDGSYSFPGVPAGIYTIAETQPTGYTDGIDTPGTNASTSIDDQFDVILDPGESSLGNDFAEVATASLAGTVFEDLDGDGQLDGGEPGIGSVPVTLSGTDDAGNAVSLTTTTDIDGTYSFDALRPGTYTVNETQPIGFLDGGDSAGSEGGDTSVDDEISAIPIALGTIATDYDFGEVQTSSIAGSVTDDGGNPIPGTTITLTGTDDLGNPVSLTTTTGAGGDYGFTDLRPGAYTVTETQPAGYADGADNLGSAGGDDSVNDEFSAIPLGSGVDAIDYDFTETTSSISGTVVDDNGVGIPNTTITLTGTDDLANPVNLTTTTDGDGDYSFTGLLSGSYTVTETQPTGYGDGGETAGTEGGDDTVDDIISTITLPAGVDATGYDFDETTSSISGTVFEDLDNNGTQDGGDAGLGGVVVLLTGTDDLGNPVIATTTTAIDGTYAFDDLIAGTYTVTELQPTSHLDGTDTAGSEGGDTSANDVITAIALPGGVDATGYDFAEIPPSSISGSVVDDNAVGIPNATITLTGTDDLGNPVSLTTTTAPDGSYSFGDLRPADYTVTETQPTGYGDGGETAGTEGGDDTTDDIISAISLGVDVDATGYDFDETTSSISGTVFEDRNNDGQPDPGEAGIDAVTVTLTGTDDLGNPVSVTATTNPDGTYVFDDLLSGDYTVTETQPAGYVDGTDDAGSEGGDTSVNDEISAIALPGGVDATDYDFGELESSTLGGTVFEDLNNDGTQDPGENGIDGVTITLTGTDDLGNPISQTTTTSGGGTYAFGNLRPGDYTVTETQPATHLDGIDTAGTEGGDTTTNDEISAITLSAFTDATGYDFAEIPMSSISGTVVDDNAVGIPNTTITLTGTDDLGNPVSLTTTTAPDGTYTFGDLRPGDYTVTETQPTGYGDGGETAGTEGGDDTTDDEISGITLSPATDATGYDFDETTSSITGTVFEDLNNDGTQDPGENGIDGVTVTLTGTDDLGNPVNLTSTTDGDGNYTFDDLLSGDYTVTETQPATHLDGIDTAGTEGGDTSANDVIAAIALPGGVDATGYDFAELPPSSISGSVVDDNAVGIPDTTITLTGTDDLGNPVSLTTTTAPDGSYSFGDLRPGDYTVTETQPVGYGDGGETAGTEGGDTTVNDEISAITITPGTTATGYDFDETTSSITGTVFEDLNNDGQPDLGEAGIDGVTVALTGTDDLGNPINLTTTTDTDGNYTFDDLLSGDYTVTETQPAAYADGIDDAGSEGGDTSVNDEISAIALPGGVDATGYDFGELELSEIAGAVFEDLNNDGTQDPGEDGIDGVTVALTGTDDLGDPVSLTTTTDTDGSYEFPDLRPGDYQLNEAQPATHLDGIDTAGTEGGDTSVNDEISAITLPAFTDATGYDFAELPPSSISGSVVDDNAVGIPNTTITLTGTDDLGNPVSLTTTTAPDGSYTFDDLRPGDYTITETQPTGYGDGGETAGTEGGDTTVNDEISGIALSPATDATGYDFDETTSSITGTVFDDLDNDGVQDASENGVDGVTITLTGTDDLGNPVNLTTTTDGDGNYTFDDLLSGDYTITETQPTSHLDGIDTAGTEGGDSSVNDEISAIALPGGVDATDYDFAEIQPSSISGNVEDDFGNPIPGTTITLTGTDDLGNPVSLTTTTAPDGSYSFADLRPGDYTVTETQPIGYGDGGENPGTEGGDASTDDIIAAIPIIPGTTATGYDFDETTSSIAGLVFHDRDDDGVQVDGEPGIEGVTVTLTGTDDLANPVTLTTMTDAQGAYVFENLIAGTYTVTETQPVPYLDGIDTAGSLGGDPSTDDVIADIVVPAGVAGTGYMFAELGNIIDGTVWLDTDEDGVLDPEEASRLEGVALTLIDTDGNVVGTATTDEFGNYAFPSVPAGDYIVDQTQPEAYLTTTDNTVPVTLPIGGLSDVDFGEDPGSVAGVAWDDDSQPDGVEQGIEPRLAGVALRLLDPDGTELATTTTESDGSYRFEDLPAGDYLVEVVPPDGDTLTAPNVGSDDTVDSDFAYIVRQTVVILDPGEDVDDIDAGLVQENLDLAVSIDTDLTTVSVGDRVPFQLTAQNTGNTPVVGGVEVTVTMPSSMRIEGADASAMCAATTAPTGSLMIEGAEASATADDCWQLDITDRQMAAVWTGDLLPNESAGDLTLTAEVTGPGSLVVNATIAAVDGSVETTQGNNNDSAALTAVAQPSALAFTGSDARRLGVLALLILALGVVLVAGGRRRWVPVVR